jgi:hypothetical protein
MKVRCRALAAVSLNRRGWNRVEVLLWVISGHPTNFGFESALPPNVLQNSR